MLIDKKILVHALQLCGIYSEPTFAPFVCSDPDTTPTFHNCFQAIEWKTSDRNGVISKGLRVTEFKNGKQKVLPFGESVAYKFMDGKKERTGYKDSEIETEFSIFRFSQYGTG